MIVCGLPAPAVASSLPTLIFGPWVNAFTTRLTSWKAATEVAPAVATTIRNAPSRKRFQSPCPRGFSSGNAKVSRGLAGGYQVYKLHDGPAVARQGRNRHPLLRPVVAGALGPELDRGGARLDEADRIRGAVAAHRDALGGRALGDRLGEQLHVRIGALDDGRRPAEDLHDGHVGDRADVRQDLLRVLARQVAH